MKKLMILISATILVVSLVASANSATFVAGLWFDDNAFADKIFYPYVGSDHTNYVTSVGGSQSEVVTDADLSTYLYCNTVGSPGVFMQIDFLDNKLINGPGPDLALFELGTNDRFDVMIGTTYKTFNTTYTGYRVGIDHRNVNVNAALIDLSEWNLFSGAVIGSVTVRLDLRTPPYNTVPTLAVVGALNSTPVPIVPSSILLLSGAGGLIAVHRKRNT
ncbi:MAG TPA: hypothetical protein ENG51_11960 [Deltaproteobacteria bacterium]|nr:hypothetical protein [Deltaproteobacteria bacterium]